MHFGILSGDATTGVALMLFLCSCSCLIPPVLPAGTQLCPFFLKFNFQLELDKKVRKLKTLLLLLHTVEYCAGTALGMESGRISDADISASSSYARSVGPEHARYKFASASLSLKLY